MEFKMFSGAGKIYDKCKRIKPMNKTQREKVYASCEISADSQRQKGNRKFSPFNTVARSNRDSYLYRVTKEPNTQTNYQLNFDQILHRQRRSTIDKANFKRIIGPVNQNDFSKKFDEDNRIKCKKSFTSYSNKRPLTVRETHQWRKTQQNLDFKKQINPQRNNPKDFIKTMKSTKDSFMIQTLKQTTQSNFNNFKRFSFKSQTEKSHDFKSDFGHQYLKKVYQRQIQPQYDITTNKQEFFRQSMRPPKGQMRIDLNRDQIKTRFDRADPNWLQTLDYEPDISNQPIKEPKSIDFNLILSRQMNEVHSKYPMRQTLKPYVPLNMAK